MAGKKRVVDPDSGVVVAREQTYDLMSPATGIVINLSVSALLQIAEQALFGKVANKPPVVADLARTVGILPLAGVRPRRKPGPKKGSKRGPKKASDVVVSHERQQSEQAATTQNQQSAPQQPAVGAQSRAPEVRRAAV